MTKGPPSPARAELFTFGSVQRDGTRLRFSFSCSRFGSFTEEVEIGEGAVPERLISLLQVALGVSTYKAAAAKRVVFPPLSPAGRQMAEALYTEGLAEFFVRAGLSFPPKTRFEGEIVEPQTFELGVSGVPLVAFGGGKDSYVAREVAKNALGTEPVLVSVILSDAVGEKLTEMAPYPPILVRRKLDPKLLSLNGAYKGHVPITAINILIMVVIGFLRRSGPILFANERSADEPTMQLPNGSFANHQYSKSSAFETMIRDAIGEAAPEAPTVYSVLRPFSELWIAERFSSIKQAFGCFSSCNRNFRLAGGAAQRWCGRCAKCAFTSLMLAPFITRDEGELIFSRTMLDEPDLMPFYREILGLSDHKPWDCVGTVSESQAALFLLSQKPAWAETLMAKTLMPELVRQRTEEELRQQVIDAERPALRRALPPLFHDAALGLSS